MRRRTIGMAVGLTVLGTFTVVSAHMAKMDLPEGPVRDRHELMEGIGKNSKIIGDALKAGTFDPIAAAAEKIQADAAKINALFPEGSLHPKSRAKPEIWTNRPKFEGLTKDLATGAGGLVNAAKTGGDVPAAAKTMFGTCKSCHDDFRKPEKKKGKKQS